MPGMTNTNALKLVVFKLNCFYNIHDTYNDWCSHPGLVVLCYKLYMCNSIPHVYINPACLCGGNIYENNTFLLLGNLMGIVLSRSPFAQIAPSWGAGRGGAAPFNLSLVLNVYYNVPLYLATRDVF